MNVGEYVRTKNMGGSIEKIIEILPKEKTPDLIERYVTDISEHYNLTITKNDIIKSSPQIIDLIEENDYIRIITDTDFRSVYSSYGKLVIYRGKELPIETFSNKFIGGIITHEQMESMQYRVEE